MFQQYNDAKNSLLNYLNSLADTLHEIGETQHEDIFRLHIEEFRKQRFNIAIVGGVKRGKSTLLNTLLRQHNDDISPVNLEVCTGAVVRYLDLSQAEHDASTPHALVWLENETEPRRIDWSDIRAYVSELQNRGNTRGLSRIEVYGNFPMLRNCCLVDTPGENACIERHSQQVRTFLPVADAVIMTISSAQAMSNADHIMLHDLKDKAADNLFYVVTRMDQERKSDIPEIIQYVRSQLPTGSKIYPTACKPIFDALCEHANEATITRLSQEHGLSLLTSDLEKFIIENSTNNRLMAQRIRQAIQEVHSHLQNKIAYNKKIISAQEVNHQALQEAIQNAKKELKAIEKETKRNLSKFNSAWERAMHQSMQDFEQTRDIAVNALEETIRKSGMIASLTNIWKLDSLVAKQIQGPVSVCFQKAEERLETLVAKLDEDMTDMLLLINKRIESALGVVDKATSGLIVTALATCTTAGVSTLPSIITSGISLTQAMAAAAGPVQAIWALACALVGKTSGAAAAVKTATTAFVASLQAAVVPLLVASIVLVLTRPISQAYAKGKLSSTVDKKLDKSLDELRQKVDALKHTIITSYEQTIEERSSMVMERLEKLEDELQDISPERRAQLISQNKQIEAALNRSGEMRQHLSLLNA